MFTCCKCKIEKDNFEFAIDKTNNKGRSCTCKECKNIYKKDYRLRPGNIIKERACTKKHHEKIRPRRKEIKELKYILSEISKREKQLQNIIQRDINKVNKQLFKYYNTPILYKKCAKCHTIQDIDCFETSHKRIDGSTAHQSQCDECRKLIHLKSAKKQRTKLKNNLSLLNIEKQKAHERYLRYKEHPNYKARRRLHSIKRRGFKKNVNEIISLKDIKYIKEQFNNQCFNCESIDHLEIDHYYPLSA